MPHRMPSDFTLRLLACVLVFSSACTYDWPSPTGPDEAGPEGGSTQDEAGLSGRDAEMSAGDASWDAATRRDASSSPTDGGATRDARPGQNEPCSTEGALRCAANGAGQREICEGGVWTAASACDEGSVCTTSDDGEGGVCQEVAEICKGSGGSSVCDGQGVMYECDADGLVQTTTPCESARHCQMGVDEGECPACLRGTNDEYLCEGAELRRCNEAADGYAVAATCESADLCNETAGACTDAHCSSGQMHCDGDVLERCNADQTAFEEVETCDPGLCDAESGGCDVCVPGTTTCQDDATISTCSESGDQWTQSSCPQATPVCVGEGRCVECGQGSDCPNPGECARRHCNTASGQCEPAPVTRGQPCQEGYCDGEGQCTGCTSNGHCPDSLCNEGVCNGGSCELEPLTGGTCSGTFGPGTCSDGECAECTADADCTTKYGDCYACDLSTKRCQTKDRRAACSRAGGASGLCDDGRCKECISPSDCGSSTQCVTYSCSTSGRCSSEVHEGNSCSTWRGSGVCSASGTCEVPVCGDGQVEPPEECDPSVTNAYHCSQDCEIRESPTGQKATPTAFRPCSDDSSCGPDEACGGNVFTYDWMCHPLAPCSSVASPWSNSTEAFGSQCIILCSSGSDSECPSGWSCQPFSNVYWCSPF